MDLVACNEVARQNLVDMLFEINDDGTLNRRHNKYVSKTFPILLDICRLFTEQAVERAKLANPKEAAIIDLLKPYFMFESVLGKCPQITSLMYHYFETSYFQPLPDNLFDLVINVGEEDTKVLYNYPGFTDNLLKEVLRCLFKYLSYNPKWFSTIWNWSELGRIVTAHCDADLRYLAGCCLSVITRPTRNQHILFMRHIVGDQQLLVELQVKHRGLFMNTFRPYIETDKKNAEKFADIYGKSETGYSYCQESIAKLGNILLLKRDINSISSVQQSQLQETIKNFIPVAALDDTISKISYSISVNKPCLIRGASGAGKTAILDYIAAQVNRLMPPDYIKVQISDQIDSKLLIGSYTCTEIPGQFEWQPGPLTRALTYGSWIVFEDIDSAPADMLQVLHSVIENGTLSCVPSCPMKLDKPHPDSRIFFTQRNRVREIDRSEVGFVRELCDVVDVPDLKYEDLEEIIQTKYNFGQLTETILRLFNECQVNLKRIEASRLVRPLTPRDLFKLCRRISKDSPKLARGGIPVPSLENLFLNAIDCFAAFIPKTSLIELSENLGQVLNISPNEVKRILCQRRPDIKEDSETFSIGRAVLKSSRKEKSTLMRNSTQLAHTKQSLQILESISNCVSNMEPVLLVGETGVGKTSIVQHLADTLNVELIVVNLSHQSDSADLLGGYKPVDLREVIRPIHMKFDDLFQSTYDMTSNQKFLRHVHDCFLKSKSAPSQWVVYLKLLCTLCNKAHDNKLSKTLLDEWIDLHIRVKRLLRRVVLRKKSSPMGLKFSDGTLLSAVKNGKWILLDEINLAEPDVLQCIWLILDSIDKPRVFMPNINGEEAFSIHKNFRLFACMNPATDVGKKDLDPGTRSRFTEIFVDDITEKSELRLIAEAYVKSCLSTKQIESIINFYLELRDRRDQLRDVSGNPPLFSLRTLCRALSICSINMCRNIEKSLLESLRITFFQQLDDMSMTQVIKLIESNIFPKNSIKSLTNAAIPEPQDGHQYVLAEGFWIQKSNEVPSVNPNYILTPSVRRNLQNIARIISLSQRKLPILLQGNTSVGKTSLILYLAQLTGNKCYRINNHEHTDLQEYVGRYILREDGELIFQEGLLVRAMKKGHWLILDELNLAPSELLEALNRLLDENRELYIAETGESLKAHSKFILFATQNPPQEYAGRKLLSRAFRNRFIELHFDEIPRTELETILEKRCLMAPKYAKKIIEVMALLQLRSRESGCFSGKNSFMTMRDLFRWGERYRVFKDGIQSEYLDWELILASQGLILLEGRVRTLGEANTVKEVLEQVFNRTLDRTEIYGRSKFNSDSFSFEFRHIHFSPEFQRLFVQLTSALKYKEPVLLCGQTGSGKTTACQLYADMSKQELITYNCHQNTESADFVGGVRPCRDADSNMSFAWVSGPLVEAMKRGAIFLMDEISLADDAVLERINSVLETERSITLTEKNGIEIFAASSFRFVATMNPGGDYGKKELSTALRNRFTEIYCHNTTHIDQIRQIIQASLPRALLKPKLAPSILQIMSQFLKSYYFEQDTMSIRDVLNWCKFIIKTTDPDQLRPLSIQEAIVNGASLVFFDQFGTSGYQSYRNDDRLKSKDKLRALVCEKFGTLPIYTEDRLRHSQLCETFKFNSLVKGPVPIDPSVRHEFILDAPIVKSYMKKIIRAMQLDRPILLEGAPGVGKTSIVAALAKLTGHELVRINLSDQTDISDLIGADLPDLNSNENEKPTFCWRDGPFLRAIKESQWILLDEMNLASQSVLEGLNACFDHRGEIFIPELNKKIVISKSTTRVFASQNPHHQGASRKGLPKSFLNRFTSIYIQSHSDEDLFIIVRNKFPSVPDEMIENMIKFNNVVKESYQDHGFEFNLRDILYWCELLTKHVKSSEFRENNLLKPELFAPFVYLDRIRWPQHKIEISDLFEQIFNCPIYEPLYRNIQTGEYIMNLGRSILPRKTRPAPHLFDLCVLKYQLPYMESIAKAIEFKKMPIIVGEPGVGKRSMVRILAGLTGNELHIIGANCEMDTTEFLGSYEQKSAHREVEELVEEAEKCILEIVNSFSNKNTPEFWRDVFSRLWLNLYPSSIRNQKLSKNDLLDSYRNQLMSMQDTLHRLQSICGVEESERLEALNDKITSLNERILSSDESMYSPGHFQWIDSVLTKAIRDGSWLLIENASLVDPAIFDRLNSLFEPKGSIALIEKGSNLDGVETLVPHKDFRLILTVNPEHGELSSAIRNRGAEIFVRTRFFFEDFLMLLNQCGFEPEKERVCMTYCIMQTSYDVHQKLTGEDPAEDGSLLSYFGLNYISTLSHEIRRGVDVDKKLADLLFAFYKLKGYVEENDVDSIRNFVSEQIIKYGKSYLVDFQDERYKWMQLRHDLAFLTGGDAITEKLERENGIFFEDCYDDLVLKPDEKIDHIDVVNSCTTLKIFLEQSTHGDFDYRKRFIVENFHMFPKIVATIENHLGLLNDYSVPLIKCHVPRSDLAPIWDLQIDTRNSQYIHYYLQSLDLEATIELEQQQNRWIFTLQRIMLSIIVDLIEDRSTETPGLNSLWQLSERVRVREMAKEHLIHPTAEIVCDLYDLLDGIVRVASNRCFNNDILAKMLPRLFWISFFICKLRKRSSEVELIATCNQIPMLWALTYQKVVAPTIKDLKLADIVYKNKKVSNRIQHICDCLDMPITKATITEKSYRLKVINLYASTSKLRQTISEEVEKLFAHILARFTHRAQSSSLGSDNTDTLVASGLVWSKSPYMAAFYEIEDKALALELLEKKFSDDMVAKVNTEQEIFNQIQTILMARKIDYQNHEESLRGEQYRAKCLNFNRQQNALDQFSPLWQLEFIHLRLASLNPNLAQPTKYRAMLKRILRSINGIILSPRYYSTVIKFLQHLEDREEDRSDSTLDDSNLVVKMPKENVDIFTTHLVDHLLETVVLDNQIVGWTKLRVTTCDLPALAPLIPEYSPLIALVGSYSLDVSHLKLNSYRDGGMQLDSLLAYLWHNFVPIKTGDYSSKFDLHLAQELIHLRLEQGLQEELVGSYQCPRSSNCQCLDEYIKRRLPRYEEFVQIIKSKLPLEFVETTLKATNLIYFGYFNYLEYAPLFTFDPSLRSREKLDVYKSELAQIKMDLHLRNTLFYWKTGENLQLNEIDSEGAATYPFATRILVDRRIKLEKSINRLKQEYNNRPKSNDGSLYFELRKEVEVDIDFYTSRIHSLLNEIIDFACCSNKSKEGKFNNIVTKCRTFTKNLERSILRFRSEYSLYTDLTTNFLVGMCFVLQGLRCLYSRFEQRVQINNLGFTTSIEQYLNIIKRVFSFNDFSRSGLDSVRGKLRIFPLLDKMCPQDKASRIQSVLLQTVLIQLNHHIVISPPDIKRCVPIVRSIADLFCAAWIKRKQYLEEQRKQREELYQYRTSNTTLGNEISYEKQEFLDICAKFPLYDHVFQNHLSMPLTSAEKENLDTEEKIINLNRSVDLSLCIDICKAHYKFTKEAGQNLLGQIDSTKSDRLPDIQLKQMIKLEAETLYSVVRHCIPTLNTDFDSFAIECHMLQANQLKNALRQTTRTFQHGSLKSSIEILDENIFDIYLDSDAFEALKLQEFIIRVNDRIRNIQTTNRNYDSDPTLFNISRLNSRISSFLLSDPLMKFITGSHALLEKLEEWNKLSVPKADKMIQEAIDLVNLIKSWRSIEIDSWRSSLHRVKRKYIDNTLCDLWFTLYEAFKDPIRTAQDKLRSHFGPGAENFVLTKEYERFLYEGFSFFIKEFIMESTLGDYQIRLDLVFSFVIQTRFASLYEQTELKTTESDLVVDYEKLTSYTFNTYRLHRGLMEPIKESLDREELEFSKKLNEEIRIVNWQGRNLWEVKNNFRISHRKLNKVMNKYLEVLRRPQPGYLQSITRAPGLSEELEADKLAVTLGVSHAILEQIEPPRGSLIELRQLKKIPHVIVKMKELFTSKYLPTCHKYAENLATLERSIKDSSQEIENFYSHKVQEIIITAKDTKELKQDKQKLCRQMYHSKKSALQRLFKELQALGLSYLRGKNSAESLDCQLLSLEPLRGMIHNQSKSVSEDASWLVDEKLIISISEQYRTLVAQNMYLLSLPGGEDLTTDQLSRIQGYALDIEIDIIKQKRGAAGIFKHLVDIHAAATRLRSLERKSTLFNFSTVYKVICQFNELVGRSYLALSKLEELACCRIPLSELRLQIENSLSGDDNEESVLIDLIDSMQKDNSILTDPQYHHIKSKIQEVRHAISEVSYELRDMLNCNIRNYLYSSSDYDKLQNLYDKFLSAFKEILSTKDDESVSNSKPGTLLGSFWSLLEEAEQKVKPSIEEAFTTNSRQTTLDRSKLYLRLQKLIRQVKLASQEIYENESDLDQNDRSRVKPYHIVDSCKLKRLLHMTDIAKSTGDCFRTLNRTITGSSTGSDISSIILGLSPLLSIFTQTAAFYLNISLANLHVKLIEANQLVPFFIDLVSNGFGLPYKVSESAETDSKHGKTSEDNTGFGEGEGDKDASKKIEFESELDDLKKNDEDKDKSENEEPIEAHNDGIEMSDDIDKKAEGADVNSQEDGDDEEQEDLDQLDKEMDTVDEGEVKLKPEIWGDEDEPLDEDDEKDLREADADPIMEADKEEIDLQAIDDTLTTSKPSTNKDDNKESASNQEEDEKSAPNLEEPENLDDKDKNKEIDFEGSNKDNQQDEGDDLDVEDESKQAKKNSETNETKSDEKNEEIDMDLSSSIDDDNPNNLDAEENKSEGELSAEEDENDNEDGNEKDGETLNEEIAKSTIDDSEIDNQLETAIEMDLAKELADPIKDIVEKQKAGINHGEKETDSGGSIECKAFGTELYVCLFDETDKEDPLDIDDESEDKQQDVRGENGEKQPPNGTQQQLGEAPVTEDERALEVGGDLDDEIESKSSRGDKRRTLAEPNDSDQRDLKRQKILDASDSNQQRKEDHEKSSKKSRKSGEVRHIEEEKDGEIECIDLVSDNDDDCLIDDQPDNCDNNQLKLQVEPEVEKDNFAKALDLAPNQEEIDVEKVDDKANVVEPEIDVVEEPLKESEEVNDTTAISSLSSLESGELREEIRSDDEDIFSTDEAVTSEGNTTYNTNLGLLKYISLHGQENVEEKEARLMEQIDIELSRKSAVIDSVDAERLVKLWLQCTKRNGHLVQELCQQLQIVLQPTRMSKYKGDYKSGKRLNMRKLISYIASDYRKDKIWLRRTKPSKRTYNIILAVDNSASMSDNNCRQMSYQSLALLAKSLSLIEAGSLSVVSFGEQVKCIHDFGQPYCDAIGAQFLRDLRFNETKTSYKELLRYSCGSFAKQAQVSRQNQASSSCSQLLIILSDGRNVTSEEEEVKNYLRQLKDMGILTLFMIIDDLKKNKNNSIITVQRTLGSGANMTVVNYMELFPFPFYVLVRKLETMPMVLGDALRQWFELVNSGY